MNTAPMNARYAAGLVFMFAVGIIDGVALAHGWPQDLLAYMTRP